jgi:two-component system sensor histidine kinase DctS
MTRARLWSATQRRWTLWGLLVLLLLALLGTLVWLAGRYEASQVQQRLERDAGDAGTDLRTALTHNVQSLLALQVSDPSAASWAVDAAAFLREHRELVRVEWRSPALVIKSQVDSPFREPLFELLGRDSAQSDLAAACANARRFSGPAYSPSYFVPQGEGDGTEVLELCLPLLNAGQLSGYLLATYSLQEMLATMVNPQLTRAQEISFTEADGARLAVHGTARRGSRVFTAQQLLDLPGTTLVLRLDSWRGAPDLFPNVLTALVGAMSLALLAVLALLANDMRRRLAAERELAEALAFRKAMEDSLVTGLRARDLDGRISYVNPAFCTMVGFAAQELLGSNGSTPISEKGEQAYWPPELADSYRERRSLRLAGEQIPSERFEAVFMRKDGTRFPVLIIEAPLINAQGQHTGWMSAILDISEQRRVEELSRASQERLQATARLATVGEMASLLSHELNQPLAAISSYATGSFNLLQQDPTPLAQDLLMAMRRIIEQAERAGKIIKSVHDFVRRRDQERAPIAPQALLDDIMPLIHLQAQKLHVQVQTQVDADLPELLCDRTMVEQVLLNLARNAMQAMDWPDCQERLLRIRVRRLVCNAPGTHDWLEFSVADGGPGISPEVARQLFTPFFTTKPEGMGLGLSLCRTVVEQHGGLLGHAPNQPRGTRFSFTLPVVQDSGP